MEIDDLLKTTPKSETISEILEYFAERIDENKESHLKLFSEELLLLDRIITQFFFLSYTIRASNGTDKFPGRFFFGRHYINTIANNFYTIKELFISGFHVQFQLMIRNQFEYVNNLIAFIGDDDFFRIFALSNEEKNNSIFTPKPIHAERAIRKLTKEYNNDGFDEFWKIFKEIMTSIYSDLSESTHGNIVRVALQSHGETENQYNDNLAPNICGVLSPLPATKSILRQSLNYFQITYRLLWIQMQKKDMFDKNSPFYDFVNHYSDKFELMRKKE